MLLVVLRSELFEVLQASLDEKISMLENGSIARDLVLQRFPCDAETRYADVGFRRAVHWYYGISI